MMLVQCMRCESSKVGLVCQKQREKRECDGRVPSVSEEVQVGEKGTRRAYSIGGVCEGSATGIFQRNKGVVDVVVNVVVVAVVVVAVVVVVQEQGWLEEQRQGTRNEDGTKSGEDPD